MTTRRALLSAIPALICAPAIVRVSSLMRVKPFVGDGVALYGAAHPIIYSNLLMEATDLNEASLELMLLEIKRSWENWPPPRPLKIVPPWHPLAMRN